MLFFIVLKPFKSYLGDKCGPSVWLKLFRRFNEFVHTPRRDDGDNARNEIIMTNPPHNPVRNQLENGIAADNPGG